MNAPQRLPSRHTVRAMRQRRRDELRQQKRAELEEKLWKLRAARAIRNRARDKVW